MEIRIEKVLCPVDFSPFSAHALDYAVAMAGLSRAELILLHVMELPAHALPGNSLDFAFSAELIEEHRKTCAERLDALLTATQARYPNTRRVLVSGIPFLEIIQQAKQDDVDLIVMGTHGRTGLAHVLIGSVAEKVVRKAPCPVLTIKHPEHEFVMP